MSFAVSIVVLTSLFGVEPGPASDEIDTEMRARWRQVFDGVAADYKGKEVWQAIRDPENTISHNADHTYWVFHQPFDPAKLDAPKKE